MQKRGFEFHQNCFRNEVCTSVLNVQIVILYKNYGSQWKTIPVIKFSSVR